MEARTMTPRVRLHPPEGRRFLPEGLQAVVHDGRRQIAGVCIQLGKTSRDGGLWFHEPDTNATVFVPIPDGRPGWFRPTSEANTYVVGLEDRLALYKIAGEQATLVRVLATAPGIDSPRIMVNDGCVAPSGKDIVCGFKDFNFDKAAQLAFTLHYSHSTGSFQRVMAQRETCPNGNAFITIDGALHLLHIDTASQKMFAVPFSNAADAPPKVLIDFADVETFRRAGAEKFFHEIVFPDGLCHWRVNATGREKIVVAVFDPRTDALRDGYALQFDVTNGNAVLEAAYRCPNSPRATHPAVFQPTPGAAPQIWMTTASEGLVEAMEGANTDDVGAVFVIDADPAITGLTPNDGDWTVCNYALQL